MKKFVAYGLTFAAGTVFGAFVCLTELHSGRLIVAMNPDGTIHIDYNSERWTKGDPRND